MFCQSNWLWSWHYCPMSGAVREALARQRVSATGKARTRPGIELLLPGDDSVIVLIHVVNSDQSCAGNDVGIQVTSDQEYQSNKRCRLPGRTFPGRIHVGLICWPEANVSH